MNQKAVVKIQQEFSEEGEIGRRVRQGCCMSPLLFNIYAEAMMVEAMEGIKEGIQIGGKLLKDVRFADDQGMVCRKRVWTTEDYRWPERHSIEIWYEDQHQID